MELIFSFIEFANASGNKGPRDILHPIIKKSLSTLNKSFFTLEELQGAIYTDFNKKLDLLLLRSELNRIGNDGSISYDVKTKKYQIKVNLDNYAAAYQQASNNNEKFVRALKNYIDKHTFEYSSLNYNRVQHYLINYIQSDFYELAKLVTSKKKNHKFKSDKGIDRFIEKFLYEVILTDLDLLNSFQSIFNGIVLWYVYEHAPALFNQENPFGHKVLFLDTNIIIRILGLQDSFTNTIGQEFLKYVNTPNFECKITRRTWLEINSLFLGYKENSHKLIENGQVNHVYQIMKNRKVDPDNIGLFIQEIKEQLDHLNIAIEPELEIRPEHLYEMEVHIQQLVEEKYKSKCELIGELLERTPELEDRLRKQADHDIRSVYNIMYLREELGFHGSSFEKESLYFVTADYVLRNYCKKSFINKGQPYTISDSTLAFLLYYKDPVNAKGFSVSSFMNAQFASQNLSISNWIEYFEAIIERNKQGNIDSTQAGYLLSKVILRDDKFENNTVDQLIEDSLDSYRKFESHHKGLQTENENYAKTVIELKDNYDSMQKQMEGLNQQARNTEFNNQILQEKLNEVTTDLSQSKDVISKLSDKIAEQGNRSLFTNVFIIALGIILISTKQIGLGVLVEVIGIIFGVCDLIKRIKKK